MEILQETREGVELIIDIASNLKSFARRGSLERKRVRIDPQHLSRIFEPLFTTKSIDEGTGLGLSVVKDVIEMNGGRIRVDSALGRGAAFTVQLPVADKVA